MKKMSKKLLVWGFVGMMLISKASIIYADEINDDYSEEIVDTNWYQDTNGKWHYKSGKHDVRNKMIKDATGEYYYLDNKGIMVTNSFVVVPDVVQSYQYYFGSDGAQVRKRWVQGSDGAWSFADSQGMLMDRGIICDKGLYYVIDNYRMQVGVYNMEWSRDEYFDCEKGYNRDLPCKIGWATVDLGKSGGVSFEQLPVSEGMPKEQYEKMLEEFSKSTASNTISDDSKWATGDSYIGAALAEHGIYDYEVVRRHQLEDAAYGGFTTVYYVYIPSLNSYKYLRITFAVDPMGNPVYNSSSY